MSNNNTARKIAGATLGTLGGIVAMPFATAGVAVTGCRIELSTTISAPERGMIW